jgi:hypothetical protein
LLIDATHKKWIWATLALAAVSGGVYGWLYWTTPGGLTGGSFVGLWYGIAGSLLMIFAGLLSVLRKVPSWWWIGSRKAWLRGHIWMGLLSVLLILCHSGFRVGGPLTLALWVVFLLVIGTGVYGLVLQQFLPQQITTRVPCEAPYEQIPHLIEKMRKQADGILSSIWESSVQESQMSILASQLGMGAKVQLQDFYDRQVRPFLQPEYRRSLLLANSVKAEAAFARLRALPGLVEVKDQVTELEKLCEERRYLAEEERLQSWLHGWLLVHIPLSVALLVLSVLHIVTALYY